MERCSHTNGTSWDITIHILANFATLVLCVRKDTVTETHWQHTWKTFTTFHQKFNVLNVPRCSIVGIIWKLICMMFTKKVANENCILILCNYLSNGYLICFSLQPRNAWFTHVNFATKHSNSRVILNDTTIHILEIIDIRVICVFVDTVIRSLFKGIRKMYTSIRKMYTVSNPLIFNIEFGQESISC